MEIKHSRIMGYGHWASYFINNDASGLTEAEKSEADDSISLTSLRRVAAALDCELHYVLVPKTPLEAKLKDQAKAVARKHMLPVAHTMSLEDQAVGSKAQQAQLELIAKELLDSNWRELW